MTRTEKIAERANQIEHYSQSQIKDDLAELMAKFCLEMEEYTAVEAYKHGVIDVGCYNICDRLREKQITFTEK